MPNGMCLEVCTSGVHGGCSSNCGSSSDSGNPSGNSGTHSHDHGGGVGSGNPNAPNSHGNLQPTKAQWSARVSEVVNQPPIQTVVDSSIATQKADKTLCSANKVIENNESKKGLSSFQIAVLLGLGLMLAPGAITTAVSATMTALMIGPIGEVTTIELLANPAFMQAATKAGAIIGGGKLLSLFGVFKQTNTAEKVVNAVGKHPLEGWSTEQVLQYVTNLGLETPRDRLLLWSAIGKNGAGVQISKEFARQNGYITLEMTEGGKWLNQMKLYGENSPFTPVEADQIWREVSNTLLQKASGQVNAIVGNFSPKSAYMSELKEAEFNSQITGVDVLQLLPRIIFKG